MNANPYFPEPIVIAGNVAEAKYRIRVTFIRRVVGWHLMTMMFVAMSAVGIDLGLSTGLWILATFACLFGLTLTRRAFNGNPIEGRVSTAILVPTVACFGQLFRSMYDQGIPIVGVAPAVVGVGVFVLLCGNDFSYIGLFVLCATFSGIIAFVMKEIGFFTSSQAIWGAVMALIYLLYLSYDLSMIVRRRRSNEEAAATADLFRDLINLLTYPIRVYLHWRHFRFM